MIRSLRVKLLTPVSVGGADGAFDKPPVIRPPALRGVLRFWTRALGGDNYQDLEDRLWGETEIGQRVSILPPSRLPKPEYLGKPHWLKAVMPDRQTEEIEIRFRLPGKGVLKELQAVVWTWLHLGTIGKRSRRGFGSMLSLAGNDDLLDGFLADGKESFAGPDDLAETLKKGLARVRRILGGPDPVADRESHPWFRLSSHDQIFVGQKVLSMDVTQLMYQLHGRRNRSADPVEHKQMGSIDPRLASPMMWRVFPSQNGGWIPVMTWSPKGGAELLSRGTLMFEYLHDELGFKDSLASNPLWKD